MIGANRKPAPWQPRIAARPTAPRAVKTMTIDQLARARSIARAFPKPCAVSGRHGGVTFGAPRNAGKPPVTFDEAEFADMTDAQVIARLRDAWGVT